MPPGHGFSVAGGRKRGLEKPCAEEAAPIYSGRLGVDGAGVPMKQWIGRILLVAAVVGLIGFIVAYLAADELIRRGIETGTTAVTGTETRVGPD